MPIDRLRIWRHHGLAKALVAVLATLTASKLLFILVGFILPWLPEPIGTRAELFSEGSSCTLQLTLLAGTFGLLIGLLLGLGKLQSQPVLRISSSSLVGLLRGTPLLVQILFVYYAVPAMLPSLRLNEFGASALALAFNVGAYNAEAIRSGIIAIPKGQFEAALSLGLSKWQTLRFVILPQSFKIAIPPLMNNFVALLKDSSLSSSVGLLELSLAGSRITSETFLPVPVLMTVSVIYLIQTIVFSSSAHVLEKRLR